MFERFPCLKRCNILSLHPINYYFLSCLDDHNLYAANNAIMFVYDGTEVLTTSTISLNCSQFSEVSCADGPALITFEI